MFDSYKYNLPFRQHSAPLKSLHNECVYFVQKKKNKNFEFFGNYRSHVFGKTLADQWNSVIISSNS